MTLILEAWIIFLNTFPTHAICERHCMGYCYCVQIDGFPRSHENMTAWDATLSKHNINCVLCFDCPEYVLEGRLLERGKSSGRSDDNIDTIRKRFQTHKAESLPIIQYFENNGTSVHKIESDKGVEQVYDIVVALF